MSSKFYLGFLGCRLNESEIASMGRIILRAGHQITAEPSEADVCIVNTCAVTGEAGKKSRRLIRTLHRRAPHAKIIVTGCYSDIERETASRLPGVSAVIPNIRKDTFLFDFLGISEEEVSSEKADSSESSWGPGFLEHTRAFVKVQDGCDNRCTFCVTTIARGAGRSRKISEVIDEINTLYAAGYREVVLSGVHLGSYGRDFSPKSDLYELIRAVLRETDIPRIRISSLEPWEIHPDFFELWEDSRLCRHLHLPLQSGSDKILKRMARKTRKSSFRELVNRARSSIPGVSISTDVIVGFPGETEDDFAESLDFVEEIGFSKLHIFRYSPRPGTAAASMPEQVPSEVKEERAKRMGALNDKLQRRFIESSLGKVFPVLWERVGESDLWEGLTDTYLRVFVRSKFPLKNQITETLLESYSVDDNKVFAKIKSISAGVVRGLRAQSLG